MKRLAGPLLLVLAGIAVGTVITRWVKQSPDGSVIQAASPNSTTSLTTTNIWKTNITSASSTNLAATTGATNAGGPLATGESTHNPSTNSVFLPEFEEPYRHV